MQLEPHRLETYTSLHLGVDFDCYLYVGAVKPV